MIIVRRGAASLLPALDVPTPILLSSADRLVLSDLLQVAQVHLLEVASSSSASVAMRDKLSAWASVAASWRDVLGREDQSM